MQMSRTSNLQLAGRCPHGDHVEMLIMVGLRILFDVCLLSRINKTLEQKETSKLLGFHHDCGRGSVHIIRGSDSGGETQTALSRGVSDKHAPPTKTQPVSSRSTTKSMCSSDGSAPRPGSAPLSPGAAQWDQGVVFSVQLCTD